MSTIVSPDTVTWEVVYEDGEVFSSLDGGWMDQDTTTIEIDGVQVPLTTKRVRSLDLAYRSHCLQCVPPEPTPFFAFRRMAAPLLTGGEYPPPVRWLYTLFGYNLSLTTPARLGHQASWPLLYTIKVEPSVVTTRLWDRRIIPFTL